MKASSTLNNSNAYGFALNVIRKIVMTTIMEHESKTKCELVQGTKNDAFKPCRVKVGSKQVDCLAYNQSNNKVLALSQYHMMWSKYMAFIANDTVYIISGDVMRTNWQQLMRKTRKYVDGSKVSSTMTYAMIDDVIALAEAQYGLNSEMKEFYNNKVAEYFN